MKEKIQALLDSLGDDKNKYEITFLNGEWWISHQYVGSGEPLKQWLETELNK